MRQVIDSISDPADHLALDEAMLLAAEAGEVATETIRIWEFKQPTVVVGRASKVDEEVNQEYCDSQNIPIMRRCSGGASIVGGPGCLMYSIVLSQRKNPGLSKIDAAHDHVMKRVVGAIQRQWPDVQRQGICDVTFENRKCSGNSLRMAREHLLYHGTVLYDADLALISQCLREAPRQPEYRRQRNHDDFVTNIPVQRERLTADLCCEFNVIGDAISDLPIHRIAELRRLRYDIPAWHLRH